MMSLEGVRLNKVKLSHARAALRLTQPRLAELANVSRTVVWNAERGAAINLISAFALLHALNAVRHERGMTPLEFDQIEWKIQGE